MLVPPRGQRWLATPAGMFYLFGEARKRRVDEIRIIYSIIGFCVTLRGSDLRVESIPDGPVERTTDDLGEAFLAAFVRLCGHDVELEEGR